MKKHALLLPLFLVLVLLGAGCTQTGSVEVQTDEGTANEIQEGSTRRRAPRTQDAQEETDADDAEEESEEGEESEDSDEEEGTSASTSSSSTAELEELADEVDDLLGGMDAGDSGF